MPEKSIYLYIYIYIYICTHIHIDANLYIHICAHISLHMLVWDIPGLKGALMSLIQGPCAYHIDT